MKFFTASLILFLICRPVEGSGQEKGERPDLPALPGEVTNVESLVPEGWRILADSSGDLNGDEKDDHVVILTVKDMEDRKANRQRILIVLFDEGGTLKVVAVSQASVLGLYDGGVLGDPFESLVIERGTLLVTHYAGSSDRWGFKHRYRFQDEAFYLIGRTEYGHNTHSMEAYERDENLVTGRVIEKKTDPKGEKTETDKTLKPRPLIRLGTWHFDDLGYLVLP